MGRSKAPSLPIKALSFCRPTELRGKSCEAGKGGKPLLELSEVGLFSDAHRAVVKVFYKGRLL